MEAFTPGPWTILRIDAKEKESLTIASEDHVKGRKLYGECNGGFVIAEVFGPEREANARLIAASPAMYEALQAIDNHARELWAQDEKYRLGIARIMDLTEAALAKATAS